MAARAPDITKDPYESEYYRDTGMRPPRRPGADAEGSRSFQEVIDNAAALALRLDPKVFRVYKLGEVLAHKIAYQTFEVIDSTEIFIPELNEKVKYSVKQLQVNHPGLVCFLLFPLEFFKKNENIVDIKILFRGTHNGAGVERNLTELGGAGHQSFNQSSSQIIQQVIESIRHFKTKLQEKGLRQSDVEGIQFRITIAGHSLGAADAQRCMLALMHAYALNYDYPQENGGGDVKALSELKNVIKLHLFSFNPTGISRSDNVSSEAVAGYIAALREKRRLNLTLEVNIFHADEDGIQQTGETHLLYHVLPQVAKVRLVKATTNVKQIVQTSFLNLCVMGVTAAAVGYCTGGWGFLVGLPVGGALRIKQWMNVGSTVSDLVQKAQGTYISHTSFYFSDEFSNDRPHLHKLPTRKLGQYFVHFANDKEGDQKRISEEIENRSPTLAQLHKGIAYASLMCRRPRNNTGSLSEDAKFASDRNPLDAVPWRYEPDVKGLKAFFDARGRAQVVVPGPGLGAAAPRHDEARGHASAAMPVSAPMPAPSAMPVPVAALLPPASPLIFSGDRSLAPSAHTPVLVQHVPLAPVVVAAAQPEPTAREKQLALEQALMQNGAF